MNVHVQVSAFNKTWLNMRPCFFLSSKFFKSAGEKKNSFLKPLITSSWWHQNDFFCLTVIGRSLPCWRSRNLRVWSSWPHHTHYQEAENCGYWYPAHCFSPLQSWRVILDLIKLTIDIGNHTYKAQCSNNCSLWKLMSELEDIFWTLLFASALNLSKFLDIVEFQRNVSFSRDVVEKWGLL